MKTILHLFIVGCCMFQNNALASNLSLMSTKVLVCRSGPGVSTTWENKAPLIESSRFDITFTFSEIDLKKRTARLSGPGGSSIVQLLPTAAGLSFIEITPMGGVFLTTVFESSTAGEGKFPFADTRHNSILSEPIVSQYHGTCKASP